MIRIRGSKHAFDYCCSKVATGEALLDILGSMSHKRLINYYLSGN